MEGRKENHRDLEMGLQNEPPEGHRETPPAPHRQEQRVFPGDGNEGTQLNADARDASRGERNEFTTSFEPLEDHQEASLQEERRVAFAGPETELVPQDGGQVRGGEQGEERKVPGFGNRVQQNRRRGKPTTYPPNNNAYGNRQDSERDHGENRWNPLEVTRQPDNFRKEGQSTVDDFRQRNQEPRQPRDDVSSRDYPENYRAPRHGPYRQSANESIGADEMMQRRGRHGASRSKVRAEDLRRKSRGEDSQAGDQSSWHNIPPTSHDVETSSGSGITEKDQHYPEDHSGHSSNRWKRD